MFRMKKSKIFFNDKVKKLMRHGGDPKKMNSKIYNDKLKSLIEYEESHPTLSDSTGTTLLHMAARYDNVDMMQYSIDSGCEIDAKDARGITPLLLATKYNHKSAMRLLLDADADIFGTNLAGEYPLQMIFDRNKTDSTSLMKIYWTKVKSKSSSVEKAAELLLRAGCTLYHAAILQDAEMSRAFLDKTERFADAICSGSVLTSMLLIDSANMQVLLTHGSQVTQRIADFLRFLQQITTPGQQFRSYSQARNLETARLFAKKMIDWKLLDHDNLKFVKHIFEDADKDFLRVFLESGVVSHVQSQLGFNLLPHVYGNRSPGVIELLREKGLDSKAHTSIRPQDVTALHLAACRCIANNVKILLDAGADPNVVVEPGFTPLFCVFYSMAPLPRKIDCVDLLLRGNADVEVGNHKGKSFIECVAFDNKGHLALAEHVLAHLALLDAIGSPVKQSALEYINAHEELKSLYETCQRQLEEMKSRKVAGTISLMTVLTRKPDKIARFVGAQVGNIIAMLRRGDGLRELNEYYSKRFKDNLDRALKVNELRNKMNHLIVENITSFKGYNSVVDKIVGYFSFEELLVLSS